MTHGHRRDPQGDDEAYHKYFVRQRSWEQGGSAQCDQLPLERRLHVKADQMHRHKAYLTRLYADGMPLQALQQELREKIGVMQETTAFLHAEGPQVAPVYAEIYPLRSNGRDTFGFFALGLLLLDSPAELERFTALIQPGQRDRLYLVDVLARAFMPTYRMAKKYKTDKENLAWTGPLLRALASPPGQRALALAAHMENWCRLMRPWGWAPNLDTQGRPENLFSDFAFEVALAVCAYDLDDSAFRDHPYYPADLVDYYRTNLRHTRDAWRAEGAGAGVEIDAPPPPAPADLAKSKRKGNARWLELVCDGDTDAVESAIETIGKPRKVADLGELLEALDNTHVLQADMKDDDTVVAGLTQMAEARGLEGLHVPDGPPFGPARCSAALLAFAGWMQQRGYAALALDDGGDNWVAVLVRSAYRDELQQLSAKLGITVREPDQAWTVCVRAAPTSLNPSLNPKENQ